MIRSFGDRATEDIFNGVDSKLARRTVPKELWRVARKRLDVLHAAISLADLSSVPGNRFEALKGEYRGFYSVRINDQYRVVFKFTGGHAEDVTCADYH